MPIIGHQILKDMQKGNIMKFTTIKSIIVPYN